MNFSGIMAQHSTLLFIIFFISINSNSAHGDLHQRILETTDEIVATPDSAYLYFKRGRLLHQHESYALSIVDLLEAEMLGYEDEFHKLYVAKTYRKLGDSEKALAYIDHILSASFNNVNAIKLKAEIYFELKQYKTAAHIYTNFLSQVQKAFPEDYVSASAAWEEVDLNKANEVLMQGIEELGPIIGLLIELRDLHIRHDDLPKAILAQEEIIQISLRKEMAYFTAFEMTGLQDYLIKAEQAWLRLPQRIRNHPNMRLLKIKIDENFNR